MPTYGPYYFGVGSGNATSPASPDATNAPSLASNGKGFVGGLMSGPNTGLTGMLSNAVSGNPLTQGNPGLTSNFTGEGALNTGKAFAGQMLSGMVPGLGPANMLTALLGPLAQAFTNIGQFGQQTTPELNGEIGLGLGLSGTGPNVNANVAQAIAQGIFGGALQSGRTDSGGQVGPPGVPGVGPAGQDDGGMGGVASGPAGNPGDEDKGGMIGAKRFPSSGDGKHVQVKALPTEFVVNPKAARLHRDVLTAINSGATRAQLAGILKGGGSRATR